MGAEPGSAGADVDASGVALLNEAEALRAMDRFYDPLRRDAGGTGRVFVDGALQADGTVRDADVVRSTHDRFTDSALRVARLLRFTPPAAAGAAARVRMEVIHRGGEIEVERR